jgi:serine/threonine protein kinase
MGAPASDGARGLVLTVGQILDDRYEILAPLAEGGMGAVYRARRTLLGDEVAIKIVRADHTGAGPRERFLRESRACARLRHPHIVSILDFNMDEANQPYLVMELLNGRSVSDEIAACGPLDLPHVQTILAQVCDALQFAHDAGIVHRDLKPANIVAHEFEAGERVYKVVDFGLVNARDSDETRLTGSHEFLGTLMYASPEQLTGGTVDRRSDIYSIGAVVFEMLTGRAPFPGVDAMQVLSGHLNAPVPRPSALRPGLPAWVDLAVGRALAKNPEDRWQRIEDFGRAMAAGDHTSSATKTATLAAPAASGLLAMYELGERLGPGRLGSDVYRGSHRALGHPVAIRLLRRGSQRNWEAVRARFFREAQTLQVAHPSIIQVRDYGEEPDLVYLVTDFIEGPSLRELMNASGALDWPRLRPLIAQLLDAARTLHRRKGLLCGTSPDVMRITADEEGERLMISTAGIWEAKDLLATLQDQTLHGGVLADAELRYVPPEVFIGRTADIRSDVFTMGVLAYEMATGTIPYDGASMPVLLGHMLRGSPADPRERQPTVPESAAAAIVRALQPVPEDRFASAREFETAVFAEPLAGQPEEKGPHSRP